MFLIWVYCNIEIVVFQVNFRPFDETLKPDANKTCSAVRLYATVGQDNTLILQKVHSVHCKSPYSVHGSNGVSTCPVHPAKLSFFGYLGWEYNMHRPPLLHGRADTGEMVASLKADVTWCVCPARLGCDAGLPSTIMGNVLYFYIVPCVAGLCNLHGDDR